MRFRLIVAGIFVALGWGCQTEQTLDDPSETHFIKFYGKDGDQTGRDLVVLPDGSMVLFGTSRTTVTSVGSQLYVTRVDSKGAILWEQEFGNGQDEEARDIEVTSSGDLVVVGNSYQALDDRDVMIATLNASTGQVIKSATHIVHNAVNGNPLGDEDVSTVTETADGFIVAGSSTYVYNKAITAGQTDSRDALQLRVNADLTIYSPTWLQTFGYYSDDYSVKIVPAPPSGYGSFYIFGSTNNKPTGSTATTINYNFWMLVLGVNGDPLGFDTYSGSVSGDERGSSHCFSPAGNLMAGTLQIGVAPQDLYIMEATFPDPVNGFGLLKEKNLSINLGSGLSGATGVTASINGGYLIVSEENGFNNNQNWLLTRMNADGTIAWGLPIIFGGEGPDEIGAVKELPDGRIVLIGTMRTGRSDVGEFKMTLIKVSKDGKFEK